MSEPRSARISVNYEGKNISEQVRADVEEYSLTEVASGESDRINITLQDTQKKWIGPWMPQKGDRIGGGIELYNWEMDGTKDIIYAGEFQVDDLTFSGRPLKCSIGAVSVPKNSEFDARKITKTWEKITVRAIAEEIAQRAGVRYSYDAEEIEIESIEQNGETDCSFLYSVCSSYGLAMKIFANEIVIFDEERYEKEQSRKTLKESDLISWKYNTTVQGTYTGATFSFSDPINDENYIIDIGGGDRIMEINVTADNIKDAERKGVALLNAENKKSTTMSVKIKVDPALYAGCCVDIVNLGGADGKYYVEKLNTRVSGKGATQSDLTMRKVVDRIKTVSIRGVEAAVEAAAAEGTAYVIKAGDTLWAIAKQYLKNPVRYTEIYNANKDILEETAKRRGKKSSDNGHWIFAGTEIKIPPE